MNSSSEKSSITSDEMIERSSSWTLGCDNALLNRLSDFSKNLEQNATEINEGCESLLRDVTLLQAKLGNATNQFLMISNGQFVENRVQEYEESSVTSSISASAATAANYANKFKTKSEKEAELIAKMKEAIQIGVSCQEEYTNLLSEDKDNFSSSKLILPHLIGSSKFFSSRYVGLVDDNPRISRFKDDEQSKQLPVLQEDSALDLMTYNSPIQNEVVTAKPNQTENSINSVPERRGYTDNRMPYSNTTDQPSDFKSEQASVIKPPTSIKQTNRPSAASARSNRYFEDDGAPPPPDTLERNSDSDDDFKPSSTGTGRLFADDDDDLFNDSSLFSRKGNENMFFGIENVIANKATPVVVAPPSESSDRSRPTNLSEASSVGSLPESDNISNQSLHPVQPEDSQYVNGTKVQNNQTHFESNSKLKIPPGAVSVFGKVPPAEIPRPKNQRNQPNNLSRTVVNEPEGNVQVRGTSSNKTNNANVNTSRAGSSIETNEDHETTSQSSLISKGMTSSQGSLNEPSFPSKRSRPVSDLFDDDSDEDLFVSSKRNSGTKDLKRSSTLFEDSVNRPVSSNVSKASSQTLRVTKPIVRKSIFDDSDSDDDLFSSASSTTSSKTKDRGSSNIFSDISSNELTKKNTNLFGDDLNEDIFAKKSASVIKSSKPNDLTIKMNHEAEVKTEVDVDTEVLTSSSSKEEPKESDKKMKSDMQNSLDLADSVSQEGKQNVDSNESDKPTETGDVSAVSEYSASGKEKSNPSTTTKEPEPLENSQSKMSHKSQSDGINFEENVQKSNNTEADTTKQPSKISQIKAKLSSKDLIANPSESETGSGDASTMEASTKSTTAAKIGKPRISVKTLALGLNLNPLAMRPGAKPPKTPSIDKSESAASSEANTPSEVGTPDSPGLFTVGVGQEKNKLTCSEKATDENDTTRQTSPEKTKEQSETKTTVRVSPEKSKSESKTTRQSSPEKGVTDTSPLLANLSKGRARIQAKRRPPSKQLLRSYSHNAQIDESNSQQDEKESPEELPAKEKTSFDLPDSKLSKTVSLEHSKVDNIDKDIVSPSTEEDDIFPVVENKSQYQSLDEPKIFPQNPTAVESDTENSQISSETPKATESLFSEENSLLGKEIPDIPTPKSKSFWDDSDSEDIPSSNIKNEQNDLNDGNVKVPEQSDDDGNNLFFEPSKSRSDTKVTNDVDKVATDVVKSSVPEASEKKESDTKSDIFEDPFVTQSDEKSKSINKSKPNNQKSLFSDGDPDSDEGDIFKTRAPQSDPKSKSSKQSSGADKKKEPSSKSDKIVPPVKSKKGQKGLFDSDSDDSDDLFKTAKPNTTKTSSKVMPESAPEPKNKESSNVKSKSKKNSAKQTKQTSAAKSIFSDSSDEDLFASSKLSKKKSTVT